MRGRRVRRDWWRSRGIWRTSGAGRGEWNRARWKRLAGKSERAVKIEDGAPKGRRYPGVMELQGESGTQTNIRVVRLITSLALIVMVALGARVGFAWNQERKIAREALAVVPFQQEAGNIASALASGKGFCCVFRTETGPTAWLAPVYPVLLAGIFRIFGSFTIAAFFAAVSLNIVFSSAACIPIFYLTKRIAGVGAAAAAAWVWALFPAGVLFPFEWIWDTSLSALLGALLLWMTLAIKGSTKARLWSGYGALWGGALLTNPALGAIFPFLGGWAALGAHKERGLGWKFPIWALAAAILCCLPWTIRNFAAFHTFIPLRSNFAFELWIGNNEIFDEQARNGRIQITRAEETRHYAQVGEMAYMREKRAEVISFFSAQPGLVARLTVRRIVAFWMGTENPGRDFLRTDSLLVRFIFVVNFILLLGTVAGGWALWHRGNIFWFPLVATVGVFPGLYYVTHTLLRYRHAMEPAMVILTVVAAHELWVRTKGGQVHAAKQRAGR